MENKRKLLSKLPNVDETLRNQRLFNFFEDTPRKLIVDSVRKAIAAEREKILKADGPVEISGEEEFFADIERRIREGKRRNLVKVINATGITLHTNLGRAVLSESACDNINKVARGYSNLEYDLSDGNRGSRHDHVEKLICSVTGAEAAMVVNNNAAATILSLSALTDGEKKEVIVSRGELVEIGGSFRIPEIMELSGAGLVEVGTTNRTRAEDYERAVTEDTAAVMKVHTSNYRIIGFTEDASLEELAAAGRKYDIPVIYDMGSGLIANLDSFGIGEMTVGESLASGVDVVLFSGDKLMGGPQAGIIAGRKELIAQMKRHPFARAFRVDKLTLAALEATLRDYADEETAMHNIPTLRMLTQDMKSMRKKAGRIVSALEGLKNMKLEICSVREQTGGGSAPAIDLEGTAVKITSGYSPAGIESMLRGSDIPVIARTYRDEIYLHVRTVAEDEIDILTDTIRDIDSRLSSS